MNLKILLDTISLLSLLITVSNISIKIKTNCDPLREGCIVLYERCNYQGRFYLLCNGKMKNIYNHFTSNEVGSIRISNNTIVYYWDQINFRSSLSTISSSNNCLMKPMSSIIINPSDDNQYLIKLSNDTTIGNRTDISVKEKTISSNKTRRITIDNREEVIVSKNIKSPIRKRENIILNNITNTNTIHDYLMHKSSPQSINKYDVIFNKKLTQPIITPGDIYDNYFTLAPIIDDVIFNKKITQPINTPNVIIHKNITIPPVIDDVIFNKKITPPIITPEVIINKNISISINKTDDLIHKNITQLIMTPRVIISNNFSDQTYKNVTHSDMIIYDKIIKELNESKAIFKDNSIQPKIDTSNQSNKTFNINKEDIYFINNNLNEKPIINKSVIKDDLHFKQKIQPFDINDSIASNNKSIKNYNNKYNVLYLEPSENTSGDLTSQNIIEDNNTNTQVIQSYNKIIQPSVPNLKRRFKKLHYNILWKDEPSFSDLGIGEIFFNTSGYGTVNLEISPRNCSNTVIYKIMIGEAKNTKIEVYKYSNKPPICEGKVRVDGKHFFTLHFDQKKSFFTLSKNGHVVLFCNDYDFIKNIKYFSLSHGPFLTVSNLGTRVFNRR